MSNNKGFGITIKDYAEQRGKTVQAVYQQMKRQENAQALNGHVFTQRVGNKDVKYLDEEAVRILDEGSGSTPNIVVQDELKGQLAEVTENFEKAKQQIMFQEGRIDALKEQLADKEKQLMALAAPEVQIKELKGQISDLRKDKDELKGKVTSAEQQALKANSEAYNAKVYAAEMKAYAKLPFFVRWFTKEPVLKEVEESTFDVEEEKE